MKASTIARLRALAEHPETPPHERDVAISRLRGLPDLPEMYDRTMSDAKAAIEQSRQARRARKTRGRLPLASAEKTRVGG